MKRTLCMILAAMLILASASLFACNGNNDETPDNDPSSKIAAGPTEEPTEESTEEPTETPVPEAYEPKDEYERLVIDFLDCVNRGDLEAWTELFVPNEREYKKQALEQKTIDIIYVERFDVHFMTQVDSFAALRSTLNLELEGMEKYGNIDDAPEYYTNDELLKHYFVCTNCTLIGDIIHGDVPADCFYHEGHEDYVITLASVDGEWYVHSMYSMYHIEPSDYSTEFGEDFTDPHDN